MTVATFAHAWHVETPSKIVRHIDTDAASRWSGALPYETRLASNASNPHLRRLVRHAYPSQMSIRMRRL